ncbi:hypothetical protein AVL59_03290 [Streptomyces griseochromogenes]|nr:hypothetical protein [Streptomyces griseochromogenes]ANP56272.1 hypothetical protein AVL59_03290 [Streptomyces griseochromogenes]
MRSWVLGACGAVVMAASGAGAAGAAPAPEADLVFHGSAVMNGDQVEVALTPGDNGPSAVPDASVLLRWSVPLADAQRLPGGCARTDERTVVCGTGALGVDQVGEKIKVTVRLKEKPSQLTLEVDTAWNGGVVDKNRANDQLKVLVLGTGDAYVF